MRPAKSAVAVLVAALAAGCGGNSKPDHEPDYAPPAPTPVPVPAPKVEPTPAPKTDDVAKKEPASPPAPKFHGLGPLALVSPATPAPVAPAPGQSAPPAVAPMPGVPQPEPKTVPPPEPMAKGPEPKTEFDWPLAVNGRPMSEYVKDTVDLDPAIREMALRTIPNFGPPARTAAAKEVLARMDYSKEGDPGVRAAAFEAIGSLALLGKDPGLEEDADTREAIRLLKVAAERERGGAKLHAIQTLATFGPKAESAIDFLVGQNMTTLEPAYETRRAVATTLGAVAFNERKGPNPRALHCLCDVLIKDRSAAVRLAAYQSVVMLGPPYLERPPGAPLLKDVKNPADAPVDAKAVAGYLTRIKARLQPWKAPGGPPVQPPLTGLVEPDRQVEIFARLALMRLDPKEATNENLGGIAKYINAPGTDTGPKIQALTAIAAMGEAGAKKLDDVVRALSDENPNVASAAVGTLVSMGHAAQPAIEAIEKLKTRGSKKDEKDPKDFPVSYWEKLSADAVKAIKEAKPAMPAP